MIEMPEILKTGSHKWTVLFPGARGPEHFKTQRAAKDYLRRIWLPVQIKRATEKVGQ